MAPRPLTAFCALFLTACAGHSTATGPATPPALAKVGADYTLNAAIPDLTSSVLIHTDGGASTPVTTSLNQAADLLAGYDVVFLGEIHRHIGVHLAQMGLFREIHARAPQLSLSMEQFERDGQDALNEYLAGKIGEYALADRVDIWQGYGTAYRPLVEYAKAHALPVIAANAPGMVVRCVGLEGPAFLDRMKPDQRAWAARELNLHDGPYKDRFLGFVTSDAMHGGDPKAKPEAARAPSEGALRSFAAQVTRDDTMAESIALHLQQNPGRKVVHLTGHFHSDAFLGTVERLRLRMPALRIAVVTPIQTDDDAKLTLRPDDLKDGTFLLAIRPLPAPYATDEEMRAAMKRSAADRPERVCEL